MRVGPIHPKMEIKSKSIGTMSPKEHGECFVLKGDCSSSFESTMLITLMTGVKVILILAIMKGRLHEAIPFLQLTV